jgi:hypothetical protein
LDIILATDTVSSTRYVGAAQSRRAFERSDLKDWQEVAAGEAMQQLERNRRELTAGIVLLRVGWQKREVVPLWA